MLQALLLFAENGATEGAKGQQPPDMLLTLLPMLLIFLAFYLIVLRPGQRRAEREKQAMLNNLKKNDRVLTIAGIYGTIVSVSDKEDEIVVKVDDNARIRMTKNSILRNYSQEEAAQAAKNPTEEKKDK